MLLAAFTPRNLPQILHHFQVWANLMNQRQARLPAIRPPSSDPLGSAKSPFSNPIQTKGTKYAMREEHATYRTELIPIPSLICRA